MATFNKYNPFANELSKGSHNLQTDVFKVALTNTAPADTDGVWSTGVYPAPAAANGYTAGGNTITTSSATTTAGVFKLVLADSVFTASGGNLGPFQYVILYNSSKANKLVGWYDYGSGITLASTQSFTVDFDGGTGVIQLS